MTCSSLAWLMCPPAVLMCLSWMPTRGLLSVLHHVWDCFRSARTYLDARQTGNTVELQMPHPQRSQGPTCTMRSISQGHLEPLVLMHMSAIPLPMYCWLMCCPPQAERKRIAEEASLCPYSSLTVSSDLPPDSLALSLASTLGLTEWGLS